MPRELASLVPEHARHVVDFDTLPHLDTLTDLPLDEGSVDVAIFGDVLGRVPDPHRLLRAARPYLRPFGRIVCSIPNVKHFSVLVPLLVDDRFERAGGDLSLFTLEEIHVMLRASGFEAVAVKATSVGPLPERYRPLAELAGRLGADPRETVARLEAHRYLVVATPEG